VAPTSTGKTFQPGSWMPQDGKRHNQWMNYVKNHFIYMDITILRNKNNFFVFSECTLAMYFIKLKSSSSVCLMWDYEL
jgi:hypothetical protein